MLCAFVLDNAFIKFMINCKQIEIIQLLSHITHNKHIWSAEQKLEKKTLEINYIGKLVQFNRDLQFYYFVITFLRCKREREKNKQKNYFFLKLECVDLFASEYRELFSQAQFWTLDVECYDTNELHSNALPPFISRQKKNIEQMHDWATINWTVCPRRIGHILMELFEEPQCIYLCFNNTNNHNKNAYMRINI